MNVCLLNDSFPPVIDGVANVVMNYAGIMTDQDMANVIVATPKYPDADYDCYPYPVVPYRSFDTTEIVKGYRAGNPFNHEAIERLKKFSPDIIHTHCPVSSTIMARILRNETDAPIVFTYHTKFDVDIARAVKAEFLQKESIRALVANISVCDEVWVVSEGAGENLKSLGYEGEYTVVSNGVDFAKGLADRSKVREVTGDFDLPEDLPVYLFVGRLMKYKGLMIIADALSELSDEGIDYRMVFVGSGADAKEMQDTFTHRGITLDVVNESGTVATVQGNKTGRVIFTGAIHDRESLRAWNTRADLFLFPSTYDTNGIVVREAAACGLASVLIKDSCAAEGITDGRNGYLIEENGEAMATLLRELGNAPEKMRECGRHAMDEIYISWESAVHDAYLRYEELIEKRDDRLFAEMLEHRSLLERKRLGGFITDSKSFNNRMHRRLSDDFYDFAVELHKSTERMMELPKSIYYGMEENVYDVLDGISRSSKNALNDISKSSKNALSDFSKSSRNALNDIGRSSKNALNDIREKGEEIKKAIIDDNRGTKV